MRKACIRLYLVLLCLFVPALAGATALDDYVRQDDPTYAYALATSFPGPDCMVYVLDMASQTWRPTDVDKPVWRHWVTIIVPRQVRQETALLIVAGGNNKHDRVPKPEGKEYAAAQRVVSKTGGVVVILQGVPSEPLVFLDEGKPRSEDEIIAYSFKKFVDTRDGTWPLLLPMVKSAVRAMDTTQEFLKKQVKPAVDVKSFVVTGASKRGWTTWLTGAVDKRVVGIAPMVIDVLNMAPQMAFQKECYGTYSEEVKDYTDLNLTDFLPRPEAKPLLDIVDPYSYRDRLTMPKLVLVGTSDQYWTVDAAKFYYPDLLPEKYIRYEANGDHGINRADETIKALTAFYYAVATNKPMPKFTWDIQDNGKFVVTPQDPPAEVRLWRAHSDKRDFRKVTIGEAWNNELLMPASDGTYRGRVKAPKEGYDAFFVEMIYPSGLGFQYSLSTLTSVPQRSTNVVGILAAAGLPLLLLGAVGWVILKK